MAKIFVKMLPYEDFKIGNAKAKAKTYFTKAEPFRWPKGWGGLNVTKKNKWSAPRVGSRNQLPRFLI